MSSSSRDKRGFDITTELHNAPQALLEMTCSRFYIEFLGVGSEGLSVAQAARIKNHATFKVDFNGVCNGAVGARISMEVDSDSKAPALRIAPIDSVQATYS